MVRRAGLHVVSERYPVKSGLATVALAASAAAASARRCASARNTSLSSTAPDSSSSSAQRDGRFLRLFCEMLKLMMTRSPSVPSAWERLGATL